MLAINEDRILGLIKYFVAKPDSILKELVQNSRRARAKNVYITLKDGKITYKDDGKGLDSYKPLLTLGDTGWDSDTVETESPAGFGFYSLISHASQININNDLSIDCNKFLGNRSYRQTTLEQIENMKPSQEGFYLEATLLPEVELNDYSNLQYFEDMNIYVNNKQVNDFSVSHLKKELGSRYIHTEYEGNDLFINKAFYCEHKNIKYADIAVIYRGELIRQFYRHLAYLSGADIIFVIKQGSPLNLQLPFREDIKYDDKYEKLLSYCWNTLEQYANSLIERKYDFHLKEFDNEVDAKIMKKLILEKKCEGYVLFYAREHFYDRYNDKFMMLLKPENVKIVEKALGCKLAIVKRVSHGVPYFESASDKIRIQVYDGYWSTTDEVKEIYETITRYLQNIDIVDITGHDSTIPVASYDRLKDNEYMVANNPGELDSPVIILVKNRDNIFKLWNDISGDDLLYGYILNSPFINEEEDWSLQVQDCIEKIGDAIAIRHNKFGYFIDELYGIVEKHGYDKAISRKWLHDTLRNITKMKRGA